VFRGIAPDVESVIEAGEEDGPEDNCDEEREGGDAGEEEVVQCLQWAWEAVEQRGSTVSALLVRD